jgi:uncharacterized protein YkwD
MTPLLRVSVLLLGLSVPLHAQSVEQSDSDQLRPDDSVAGQGVQLSQAAQSIVEQTNHFRIRNGRAGLTVDRRLSEAAAYFAGYMARTDEYGHTADGSRPSRRAERFGYHYCIVAENIAYEYSSVGFGQQELARRFVQGWIDSPHHRENMLDRAVTDIGVAVAHSEESGNWYGVQMFGRPLSTRTRFSIANRSGETVRYSIDGRSFLLRPRYTRTHQRCRPVTIDFGWTDQDDALVPADGADYIVTKAADGSVTVTRP